MNKNLILSPSLNKTKKNVSFIPRHQMRNEKEEKILFGPRHQIGFFYSTVTDFARFLGLSTSKPFSFET